ncbi:TPA: phage tail protein [Serratia marcescens]|nr:phage tail protein [Serratia marcescens]
MAEFDNLFDEALYGVDSRIIDVMGREVSLFINGVSTSVRAVFDDPESIDYAAGGNIRIDGTSPRLFMKSVSAAGLKRLNVVMIGTEPYWVDRISPDDTGSCYIYLGTGEPPASARRR